jgi:Glucose-6-phosphate 1-dehydrogenase
MVATTANLLVMFGATGDLAQRMLLPALYGLEHDGLLPDELIILATARSGLETGHFRERCGESLTASGPVDDSRARGRLLDRIEYVASDLSDEVSTAAFARTVEDRRNGEVLFHLSTSPDWYGPVCRMLARHGLIDDGARVMLEKPIGHDLDSCQAINDEVAETFREDQVFRIDHYLGKDGVQNLLALRFGNALFEPLWNARHIEQVQITVAETIGVEGRADYYDQYGAMRDMVQNHLLQLLCLTAMEPPTHFQPKAVRNESARHSTPFGPSSTRTSRAIP